MVIKAWTYPIHEIQEGEPDRERLYLEQFFIFPGNLTEFIEFVGYAFEKLVSRNCRETVPKYDKILQDVYRNNFEFDYHDIKRDQAPSDIIRKWSEGRNCQAEVKYTWKERRTSFRNEVFNEKKEDVKLLISNALVEITEDTLFLIRENKKVVKKEISKGTYTPNKSEAASKAQKNNTDTLFTISGDDSTNIKADVTLEAEGEFGVETNLKVEDNRALSTVQAMFMQPEFIEMNKKLMDKTADELEKQRRNSNG